jgi:hypothetical protein
MGARVRWIGALMDSSGGFRLPHLETTRIGCKKLALEPNVRRIAGGSSDEQFKFAFGPRKIERIQWI